MSADLLKINIGFESFFCWTQRVPTLIGLVGVFFEEMADNCQNSAGGQNLFGKTMHKGENLGLVSKIGTCLGPFKGHFGTCSFPFC